MRRIRLYHARQCVDDLSAAAEAESGHGSYSPQYSKASIAAMLCTKPTQSTVFKDNFVTKTDSTASNIQEESQGDQDDNDQVDK